MFDFERGVPKRGGGSNIWGNFLNPSKAKPAQCTSQGLLGQISLRITLFWPYSLSLITSLNFDCFRLLLKLCCCCRPEHGFVKFNFCEMYFSGTPPHK